MEYNNWYINQNLFCCDIKVSDGYWKFYQCKVNKYDDVTKKIILTTTENNKYEFIIDFKKVDKYFVNTFNRIDYFKEYLNKFK